MALRDLLVYLDQTQDALARLRLAADLTSRHASRLTALYVREWSLAQQQQRATAEMGLVSAKELVRLEQRVEASIDRAAEQLRSALEVLGRERGLQTEWRCVDGTASAVVLQHARCADLCIVGQDAVIYDASIEYAFSEHLLFVTGRPVLFVPAFGSFETLGRHIAVAWNSSRTAARAVNDALPLIERAERTTVLVANPSDFIEQHGAVPVEQLVEHLRRHNVAADAVQLQDVPVGSIADALQAEACTLGADLIVAGGFGHSKLRERLIGGVTRDLLAGMRLPIMMSH